MNRTRLTNMKTLYVLRHAKSSWDRADLADFDRPLNDRGRSTAPFMGELMKREGFLPEMVLSSPAARARQTAELAVQAADVATEIKFKEKIYEASPQTLLQIAQSLDDRLNSVMIVGHNPGMEGFVRLMTGRLETMPTAALAVIELDIAGWEQAGPGTGRLKKLIRPKDELKTLGKGTSL
jgi:phosphohistidine phosphatase